MDSASIVALTTAFLAVISVFLGVKYRQGLKKIKQFAQLLNEIVEAAEDNEISEDELRQIVVKAKQIVVKEKEGD
jgi:hypothetical protein